MASRKNFSGRIETRRARALARREVRAARSPMEQMKLLNERLGVAHGAAKERERLCKLMS